MADENKDKQALPEGVSVVSALPPKEVVEAHQNVLKNSKEFAEHYGEPDVDTLRVKIGSNSILAARVFDDFMAEKFGGEKSIPTPFLEAGSPQEHNVTGKLDHTGDVATRIKTGPAAEVPPVVNAKPV